MRARVLVTSLPLLLALAACSADGPAERLPVGDRGGYRPSPDAWAPVAPPLATTGTTAIRTSWADGDGAELGPGGYPAPELPTWALLGVGLAALGLAQAARARRVARWRQAGVVG